MNDDLVSVIIPARNEKYLDSTIFDVITKAKGTLEVIVVLEGYIVEPIGGVRYIQNQEAKGMRTAINQGVEVAQGKYVMKLDAHCMLDEGFDVKLKQVHQPNWVQTPNRKRFNPSTWQLTDTEKPDTSYMFIGKSLKGHKDNDKNRDLELRKILLDDTEVFQGSCYFMEKEYFKKLGLLDDIHFGTMGSEGLEIAMKCRADKGRVIVNKTTWYAHAHIPRHYAGSMEQRRKSREYMRTIYKP